MAPKSNKGKRQPVKRSKPLIPTLDIDSAVSSMVNEKLKDLFGECSSSLPRGKRLTSERDDDSDSDVEMAPPPKVVKKTDSNEKDTQYASQVVILEGVNPELKKHPSRLSKAFAKTKPNIELKPDGLRLTASNDVLIKPKNPKDCNALLKENAFPASCELGDKITVRLPKSQQITHQVVIKNVDEDVTMEEMEEILNRQDLPFKLVKRIHSRKENKPTKMIRLILKDETTKKKLLKEGINLDQMHYRCVPALEDTKDAPKAMQCFKCQELGDHLSGACTKEQKCVLCAGPHRKADCIASREQYKCANCSGSHAAWSNECPRLREATEMKKTPTFAHIASATVTPSVLKQALQEVKESIVALVAEVVSRSICELVIDIMGKNLSKAALPMTVAKISTNAVTAANKLKFGPATESIVGSSIKEQVVEKCFPKAPSTESQPSNGSSQQSQ